MESWPFTIVDVDHQPKIEVEYLGEKKQFSAQEISAMVLLKVRMNHTRFAAFNFHHPLAGEKKKSHQQRSNTDYLSR